MQTLTQKRHKHFRIMNAPKTEASCLILAKVFRLAWRPGSRTWFKRRNGYWVTAGGRRNYHSGLVVKTEPSSKSASVDHYWSKVCGKI